MKMRIAILMSGWLSVVYLSAQQVDYQWWNERHGWDGVSPFEKYLNLEPGRTGPNALPVPEPVFFLWDSMHYVTNNLQYHHTSGENTASLKLGLHYHIDRRVVLNVWMVAAEYFASNEIVRDFRAARTYEGRGWATGDLYVETHWHILRSQKNIPDISLRSGLKTASGNRVEDVRFTDTPGYYFDLNFRKLYRYTNWQIQWYGMTGFYAYQTFRTDHKQNDAFLYGVGARTQNKSCGYDIHIRGYMGYLSEYDKPIVLSISTFLFLRKDLLILRMERGNKSWPFTAIDIAYNYRF